MAIDLTRLITKHGFTVGDFDTDGLIAVEPAYQKVYFTDGRSILNNGYHKLDMINTKINGTPTVAYVQGELVAQATTEAVGVFDENPDKRLYDGNATIVGTYQEGERVTQAGSNAEGFVYVQRTETQQALYVFPVKGTTFNAVNPVVGVTSGATMTPSAVGSGIIQLFYRTTTTEFNTTDVITGENGGTMTPTVVDEIQTSVPDSTSSAGTFTITIEGEETSDLDWEATTGDIEAALELLSLIGTGNVTVGGTTFDIGVGGLTFTFDSSLSDVATAVFDVSALTGVTTVTVTETTKGFPGVQAPPHWLPWTETAGKTGLPSGGANISSLSFGRIFLNSVENPHLWFASRSGDPLDWLVNQDDNQTPISAATTKAGLIGDELTAFTPYKDYYQVLGTLDQVWVMRSDPAAGGVLTNLSKSTGIFSNTAWCYDDSNNLYFVGMDGIYGLSSEAIVSAAPPTNLTKDSIPKLISNLKLNRRTDRITMAFDKLRNGISLTASQLDGLWKTTLWIDLRTGSIFPEDYIDDHVTTSALYYNGREADDRGLLLGCKDGFIRKFDDSAKSDDGSNAINSWFTIGPLNLGESAREQLKLNELSLKMGTGTDGITVDIFKDQTSERVVDNILAGADPIVSKVYTNDGLKSSLRQKIQGGAIGLKLKNENVDESFSIESIQVDIAKSGRRK
ncbi:hypothetical protein LCGC14_0936620 [marine sediment metagenome]|uniref:Uncharacterized protein n=1 Tax=marine sediment metagenome TaxID=412755 RepID=A0A0F9NQX8_9ZZZZ